MLCSECGHSAGQAIFRRGQEPCGLRETMRRLRDRNRLESKSDSTRNSVLDRRRVKPPYRGPASLSGFAGRPNFTRQGHSQNGRSRGSSPMDGDVNSLVQSALCGADGLISHLRRHISGDFHANADFSDDRGAPAHESDSLHSSPGGPFCPTTTKASTFRAPRHLLRRRRSQTPRSHTPSPVHKPSYSC
jgi:hypothetical protein